MGKCVTFLDTMRKPLKESEREKGIYPYYGASGIVDYVSDYIFDEELVLLSEDGANITDRNYPVCFLASGKYWVNNHAHVLKMNAENENNFICNSLERMDFTQYNSGMAMPKLNKDVCYNITLFCPVYEEQKQIGDFFRHLDTLITLHQREYFSFDFGSGSAKIAQNTLSWEQRKLGERMYIKSRVGWQALTKNEYMTTGDYYLITGTDIDPNHTVDLSRSYYVSKERYEMDTNIQVKNRDIIITKDGTIGKVAMISGLDKPATLNSHLFVLRDESGELDNNFFLQLLCSHIFEKFVESVKTGSTLTGLPQKTIVEFKFLYPSLEEQQKIGAYFSKLDDLITLHQHKPTKKGHDVLTVMPFKGNQRKPHYLCT